MLGNTDATADTAWEEDTPNVVLSAEDKQLQEMAVYENYIIGILTNLKSVSLERIHNMLRMFVVEPKYDKSQDQLSHFLGVLMGREVIVQEGGLYKRKLDG